eukprot:TRINITY_DN68521_c0_g1_i1.p1 TRINITY_DN68521_c0_g1~~TRINITY_DN68521_c0_g1_i1.p1  ORF type:complete len:485 (+),score=76.17 TRINITY_DN68521_c0_g1_i1:81-1535(+)
MRPRRRRTLGCLAASSTCLAIAVWKRPTGTAAGADGTAVVVVAPPKPPPGTAEDWQRSTQGCLPDEFATRNGERQYSDIPIFSAKEVPADLKQGGDAWSKRPFILRGHEDVLRLQSQLSRSTMLQAASRTDVPVSYGYSWSITANGGSGPQQASLSEYLGSIMRQEWYDGSDRLEPAYAFHRGADGFEQAGLSLPGEDHVPAFIRDWNATAFAVDKAAGRLVLLGGAGSAVGWHRHGASVQMLVHGLKRWFLYPLGDYPPGDGPGGGNSASDWLRVVYPTLPERRRPIEFIQQPGDVVYIPDGWYHAVINLADCVASTVQNLDHQPEMQERFKRISFAYTEKLQQVQGGPEFLEQVAEEAREHIRKHPENNLHARKALFYALCRTQPEEAIDVLLEGVRRDPFHVPTQFELASWLENRAKEGDEIALKAFERAMQEWRPYLEKNTRSLKALWILDRYSSLVGDKTAAARYHSRLVELHNHGIDR